MKTKYIITGVMVLSVISLAGILPVLASTYDVTLEIYQKQNGVVVWHFDTVGVDWSFNGKDITYIHAEYYCAKTTATIDLTPYADIHYSTKGVDLIFKDLSMLPPPEDRSQTADQSYIYGKIGMMDPQDEFLAYGPGWTWTNIHK
jgi:uncharacterized membrane protein